MLADQREEQVLSKGSDEFRVFGQFSIKFMTVIFKSSIYHLVHLEKIIINYVILPWSMVMVLFFSE